MSITKVAQSAGVSVATVSRVLNSPQLVNADTVQRVELAMRKLNYTPLLGGAKRGRKAHTKSGLKYKKIAFLWTGTRLSASSLTGIDMLQGVSAALRRHDVSLILDHVAPNENLPLAVTEGAVDGLLIHGPEPTPELAERLRKLPTVWLLSQGASHWGDRVRPDHDLLGGDAVDYFIASGCKRVVCVAYRPRRGCFVSMRREGFAARARERGLECIVLGGELDPQSDPSERFRAANALADAFVTLDPRPDGLFVANELGAYLHEQLSRRERRPMVDFAMIAGDRDFVPQYLDPDPVRIALCGGQIGRFAVEQLLWRIKNPALPRITQVLACELEMPKAPKPLVKGGPTP